MPYYQIRVARTSWTTYLKQFDSARAAAKAGWEGDIPEEYELKSDGIVEDVEVMDELGLEIEEIDLDEEETNATNTDEDDEKPLAKSL